MVSERKGLFYGAFCVVAAALLAVACLPGALAYAVDLQSSTSAQDAPDSSEPVSADSGAESSSASGDKPDVPNQSGGAETPAAPPSTPSTSPSSSSALEIVSSWVSISSSVAEYTGKAVTPAVVVRDSTGKQLDEGEDYTVAYKDNVLPGKKAEVIVSGKGQYKGTVWKTFEIVRSSANENALPGSWVKNSTGWWYKNYDGTWPASCWQIIGSKRYHFNAAGYMDYGWLKTNGGWYYLGSLSDGAMKTGWTAVSGTWYYLNADGKMRSGWFDEAGVRYYLGGANDGAMRVGWYKVGGAWYYANGSGAMQTGWQKIKGTWYSLRDDGRMRSGWFLEDGVWYYLGGANDGAMRTGWYKVGGTWYYANGSGAMQTGWLKEGGSWYYLNPSGAMRSGGWSWIDGVDYKFASSGRMVGAWVDVPCVMQNPELPVGCESVALTNLLKYYGFSLSKTEIADNWLTLSSSNFVTAFAGNPHYYSRNYDACCAPAIVIAANKYLASQSSAMRAYERTGASRSQICSLLSNGVPVVVWNTSPFAYPGAASAPQWYNGRAYSVYTGTHTVVIKGYDEERNIVYVSDSIAGDVTRSMSLFFNIYDRMGKQAVIVQ